MKRTVLWTSLGLLVAIILGLPFPCLAQVAVGVSIRIGPPVLPVYVQPVCPGPGYMWTPGYWAYGPDGYYWVPGTWVMAPAVGLLWTPGYWGWAGGFYAWHAGYWGPQVGFYGGINYGFGYGGVGFVGGAWNGGVFSYNRAVTNVNTTVINNYYNNTTVVNNNTNVSRVSYNGGTGGTTAQPTAQELAAARQAHTPATAAQLQHAQAASQNHALLASVNHGQPAVAATPRPGVFSGAGVSTASGYHADRPPTAGGAATPSNRPPNASHPTNSTNHPSSNNPPASKPKSAPAPKSQSHPPSNEHPQHNPSAHPSA